MGKTGGAAAAYDVPTTETLSVALLDANVEDFERWLGKYPATVIHMLFLRYRPQPTKWCKEVDLDGYARFIYTACMNGDKQTLIAECEQKDGSCGNVAEVICYYLNWRVRPGLSGATDAEEAMQASADREGTGGESRVETVVNGKVVASTPLFPTTNGKHGDWPFPTSAHGDDERERIVVDGVEFVGPVKDSAHVGEAGTDLPHEVQEAASEAQLGQGGDDEDGFAYRAFMI